MARFFSRTKIERPVKQKNPFHPPVSFERFCAVVANRPETFTGNELVDAVAVAFQTLKPLSGKRLAEYLCLDQKKLSSALEILTGFGYSELRYKWVKFHYDRYEELSEKPSLKEFAHSLGFLRASSLTQFLESVGFKHQKRLNTRKDMWTEYENMKNKGKEPKHFI